MKTHYIFILLFIAVTGYSQQDADAILASNDINNDKNQVVLLASQFQELDAETLDGVYKLLADNGDLKEVRTFDQGKLDGTWLQYDNNQNLIAIANYKDDLKHGKWVIWDANGVKRYELHYQNGERTGTWNSWDERGELTSSKQY
jgi:antitoxin component YwqK of YwqJK toxin-antitoxin module